MRGWIPAGLVLTAMLAGSVGPVRAQSLADVAKKEEERRKAAKDGAKAKDSAKVYTNKDLKAVPPPPAGATSPGSVQAPDAGSAASAASSADASNPAAAQGSGSASSKSSDTKDQAYWAQRMKDLRDQLRRDELFAEALQTRINALTTDFVNRDDPVQRAQIGTDRQPPLTELDRVKKSVEDGKKAIAAAEEEARQSGVPPGWLR
jgi:hypothetical protein